MLKIWWFLNYCLSLHCANVDALYARIEDFWDKDIDIEDWAKF